MTRVHSHSMMCVCVCALVLWCASCDTCDRSFRGPPPESEFIETRLPNGRSIIGFRDKIPKDQQVGCDVCPFWCTQFDLSPVPMDELLDMYARVAMLHLRGSAGDYPGDTWETLERMGCIAANSGPDGHARFTELLRHDDVAVRYVAAVHCLGLGMAKDEPLAVLHAIAAGHSEARIHAEIQLMEIEAGNLPEL